MVGLALGPVGLSLGKQRTKKKRQKKESNKRVHLEELGI